MLWKICFMIANILWGIEMIPQIIKTIKRKKVRDISLFMYLIAIISFLFFFAGSILSENWILFFSNFIPFTGVVILFILILKYRRN